MRINWNEIIEKIKIELEVYEIEGFKPTLRSMFYRLYTKGLIPNTSASYTSLDRATVKARWSGQLPINCFTDNSRKVLNKFSEDFFSPEEFIDNRLKIIQSIPYNYINLIPKWHNQPHYVEVWIEKDAMGNILQTILNGKDVKIIANKGFTSLTFLNECANRLKHYKRHGKILHIVYFGDFDPSGDYMVEDLIKRLNRLSLDPNSIDFKKIAVTHEQIKKYNLPFNPDKTTSQKMLKDSRTSSFIEKYGKLYAVEIDALPALIPEDFKKMVIQSVDQFYDRNIYERIIENYSIEEITELLKSRIEQLSLNL